MLFRSKEEINFIKEAEKQLENTETQKIKDKDKDGMKELVLRHLSNLIDFAKLSTKGEIPEFEYGHI